MISVLHQTGYFGRNISWYHVWYLSYIRQDHVWYLSYIRQDTLVGIFPDIMCDICLTSDRILWQEYFLISCVISVLHQTGYFGRNISWYHVWYLSYIRQDTLVGIFPDIMCDICLTSDRILWQEYFLISCVISVLHQTGYFGGNISWYHVWYLSYIRQDTLVGIFPDIMCDICLTSDRILW